MDSEKEKVNEVGPTTTTTAEEEWRNVRDDEIMEHHSSIKADIPLDIPFIADKEPLSSLSEEYKSGNQIILDKIKLLQKDYSYIRRSRGDGNCFFRSFMFSYLEHLLLTQDTAEVERIKLNIQRSRETLHSLGYADFTFEDFFELFVEQLDQVIQGTDSSISHDELVRRCRDQSVSDYVVMFFRFVTSAEIRKRSDFFEPFIVGLSNTTVDQFCKSSVEPMGEESDHMHIIALSDALGVPIRVVYLDRSTSSDTSEVSVNHHDFMPVGGTNDTPYITLLYRPGHYDILYSKQG